MSESYHDALSLLSSTRLVVAIAAAGSANGRIVDALRAAREGLSPTLAVEYGHVGGLSHQADETWLLRAELGEYVAPVLLTLPFQLLGYFMGVARGRNPDTLATDRLSNARAWLTAFPLGTHWTQRRRLKRLWQSPKGRMTRVNIMCGRRGGGGIELVDPPLGSLQAASAAPAKNGSSHDCRYDRCSMRLLTAEVDSQIAGCLRTSAHGPGIWPPVIELRQRLRIVVDASPAVFETVSGRP
jgi:hypothetical protein